MVSSNSFKPLIWVFTLGSYIGSIPASWDSTNFCIILKSEPNYSASTKTRNWQNNIVPGIYLLLQFVHIVYLIVFLLFLEHSSIDLYMSVFFLFCFIFATISQLHFFLYFEGLASLINSYLLLDLKIRK